MGNTLHKIDERADAGEILFHLPTPVFAEDDLATLAKRHYENEIWMLTHFDMLLEQKKILDLPEHAATMRMSAEKEALMLRAFPEFQQEHVVHGRH